ncbi:BREX system ATP-binding domain-containing protein [Trichothermofontia sp.]
MPTYSESRKQAIAVIESLRAGIPTRASTRALPDLRESLIAQIAQDLSRLASGNPPPGRLLWGAYGQGKTHALTAVEHMALDEGFAVSRLSLSREVSCHHLFNFYGRVAIALRTPDSQVPGIQQALDRQNPGDLVDSPILKPGRYVHPLPAIVLEDYFYAAGEDRDLLYGDLMGTRLSMPELRRMHRLNRGETLPRFEESFRVKEHASAYFGLLADAVVWCGYKGWVILIDEVELVGRLGRVSRLQAYRNLNWLLNWSRTLPYPIYTLGVVASSLRNDVWFSGAGTSGAGTSEAKPKGRQARIDSVQMPALAAERLGPEAAQEMETFFKTAIGRQCPSIKLIQTKDLLGLLERLCELHGLAYGWSAKLDVDNLLRTVKEAGSQPIRTYIRAALEVLDIAYIYREAIDLRVDTLREVTLTEDESYFALEDDT